MGLFPQSFIDELRAQADIVVVIQDYVPLKRAGASFRGLCPFHAEKTPSFTVNRDRGFFHCFGCNAGGDVFTFLELREQWSFQEAVRRLAERFGLPVPATERRADEAAEAEREILLKAHEEALRYFREQLAAPVGLRARRWIHDRGVNEATTDRLGLGFAPPGRDGLKAHLTAKGFRLAVLLQSGLVADREGVGIVDRFRGRVMIPICRDGGTVVAFGGRSIDAERQPKYLNSPETAIYSKGRVLYGLHLTRGDVKRLGYAVLVEGYFDLAQAVQAGIGPVVASCGTALTQAQARVLRRHTGRVILSFDPDAAGQGAAVRSCDLLVTEGFQVNVAALPPGLDPDGLIRRHGGAEYARRLDASRPYLDFLLDRAAGQHDLARQEGRRAFLGEMLGVAAGIPDVTVRDQFADRLAHKAGILEDVVRAEIRKAAAQRRTALPAELDRPLDLKPAEKGLLWALLRTPESALEALESLAEPDFDGLAAGPILKVAWSLRKFPAALFPETLASRLNREEASLLARIGGEASAPGPAVECVHALRRLRCERDRARVQQEIDRLQAEGRAGHEAEMDALWMRKKALLREIEALRA